MTNLPAEASLTRKELALNKAGATREAGAKAIAEALHATKIIQLDKFGTTAEEPDHAMRLKAEELRARYVGDLKPDNSPVTNVAVVNTTGVTPSMIQGMIDMISSVDFQLRGLKASGSQTGEIIDVN